MIYLIQVDIYEPANSFPIVTHIFRGKNRSEAWHYHDSHRKSDSFMKQCEDKGLFRDRVKCRVRIKEGWKE